MRSRIFDENTTSRSYRKRYLFHKIPRTVWDYQEIKTRVTRRDEMMDVVTPGFLTQRNKGFLINNPMLREKIYHDIDYTVFNGVGLDYGEPVTWDTITSSGLQVSPVMSLLKDNKMWEKFAEFDRYTDLAITRAHSNVNLSEMNLIASLGELPETVRWIRSIVTRIAALTKTLRGKLESRRIMAFLRFTAEETKKFKDIKLLERYVKAVELRKLKRLESLKGQSALKAVTDLWLEYRYAVRPLIVDLQNAINAMDKAIKTERLTARGREYHVAESVTYGSVPPLPNDNSIGLETKITTSESIKARAGCLYIVDAQLATLLDVLGLDQPVEALYELIPFSFILDWVFSIGDLLESWFKSSGLNVLQSWVTLQVELSHTIEVTTAHMYCGDPHFSYHDQNFVLGSSHSTVQWKWRKPNPQLPLFPRFDLKIDLAKLIDLGAILRSSIGGRIPEVAKRG